MRYCLAKRNTMNHNSQMQYPKCSNNSCTHNDKYDCKADDHEEDIVCKLGKSDALRTLAVNRDN
jgi:hypothetical protein